MIVRSTTKPETLWLRKIEQNGEQLQVILRVRWDSKVVKVENMDGESHNEFEYEEQEIVEVLPQSVVSAIKLAKYLSANQAILLERAKSDAPNIKQKPIEKLETQEPRFKEWFERVDENRTEIRKLAAREI